ncbi:MAG: hypothetical protein AABW50_05695 [Nanoarchaeota archaeon]
MTSLRDIFTDVTVSGNFLFMDPSKVRARLSGVKNYLASLSYIELVEQKEELDFRRGAENFSVVLSGNYHGYIFSASQYLSLVEQEIKRVEGELNLASD